MELEERSKEEDYGSEMNGRLFVLCFRADVRSVREQQKRYLRASFLCGLVEC